MIPLLSVGVILILVIVSITVIIMKYRNSKDIKLKSEKQPKNEDFYDDIKDERVNEDYAEPNYDQNYEDGSRYEYNFPIPPKLSKKEQEIEESVGEDQPYYTSLYAKEDNQYMNMRNMTLNP
jgi:hypothetical protein